MKLCVSLAFILLTALWHCVTACVETVESQLISGSSASGTLLSWTNTVSTLEAISIKLTVRRVLGVFVAAPDRVDVYVDEEYVGSCYPTNECTANGAACLDDIEISEYAFAEYVSAPPTHTH